MQDSQFADHHFRWEAGRIVCRLSAVLGSQHLQLAEDAVQESMLRALRIWPVHGIPEHPEAWLFRVARNHAISALRRDRIFAYQAQELIAKLETPMQFGCDTRENRALRDDELRMMFLCCDPDLPDHTQVALSLKLMGGFSAGEIARLYFLPEATIAQRLVRAKRMFRQRCHALELPAGAHLGHRLEAVLTTIYLMFSAGYTAQAGENLIGHDACFEAMRLGRVICDSSFSSPQALALLALMSLQASRFPARVDALGQLVPLEEQDRQLWNAALLQKGFEYFERSITGTELSAWHVEAAIAALYARAKTADGIDWPAILEEYDLLLTIKASPVIELNRAVVLGRVHGPERGLAAIAQLEECRELRRYYLLPAIRGHMLMELGRCAEAEASFSAALQCACSEPEKRFIRSRLTAVAADAGRAR